MLNIPQNSNYSTDSKIGQNGNSVASRIFEILDSRKEFQNKPEFIINGLNIERVELLEILVGGIKDLSNKIDEGKEKGIELEEIFDLENQLRLKRAEFYQIITPKDDKINQVEALNLRENIDSYLGENIQKGGGNANGVFEIKGTEFVAIKKSKGSFVREVDNPYYLSQFPDSPNIPRVLQVFIHNNHTYIVMERAKGVQLDTLSTEEKENIPQKHYDKFVQTIIDLGYKGIKIDPSKQSNFFYDEEIGFVFIDLGVEKPKDIKSGFSDCLEGELCIILGTRIKGNGIQCSEKIKAKIKNSMTTINH